MRPIKTSMTQRDIIGAVTRSIIVSTTSPSSSPISIASNCVDTLPRTAAKSKLVELLIIPALCWTICCATSNIAIVMSKVCVTSITAINALTIHL